MKCQNPKCKSRARVQTMRTKDNGEQTERVKRCSKCRVTFNTIELPLNVYSKTIADLKEQIAEAQAQAQQEQSKAEDTRITLDRFRDLLLPRPEAPRRSGGRLGRR